MVRPDGRKAHELRKIKMTPNVLDYAEGSVLVEFGQTRVICSASYEGQTPKWLQGTGQGWVTAEYGMLPRSTHSRIKRDKAMTSGRTQEISRLIGRSLRACLDMKALGEKQLTVDCDVLNADGGTRTASITGGFVALGLALKKLQLVGELKNIPLTHYVSAISVGLSPQGPILDLNYDEDSAIDTDMNFVMTHAGQFIEIQGTAEHKAFSKSDLLAMTELAEAGCRDLFKVQSELLAEFFPLQMS